MVEGLYLPEEAVGGDEMRDGEVAPRSLKMDCLECCLRQDTVTKIVERSFQAEVGSRLRLGARRFGVLSSFAGDVDGFDLGCVL